jgi:hypothetical protein
MHHNAAWHEPVQDRREELVPTRIGSWPSKMLAKTKRNLAISSRYYWSVCFFHLSKDASKFFGFTEYFVAVALMALAWTIADVRYKFRIATAPIPLQVTTYSVVDVIGLWTRLTDWWRAEQ